MTLTLTKRSHKTSPSNRNSSSNQVWKKHIIEEKEKDENKYLDILNE